MFDKSIYGPILVPILTPFADDQSIDYGKLKTLTNFLIETKKADSLIVCGTTGEFHVLTFDERVRLFEATVENVAGRIPLIAGVGSTSTIETIALAKKALALGINTVMVVAPYYSKPTQSELFTHYAQLATEVPDVDILLYNIPIFTGVNLDTDTVARLAQLPNIVAIKDEAELNPKQITAFLNATPDDFIIYNGDDTMILETYAQGGRERIGGVVSGAAHLVGPYIRDMISKFLAGDVDEAAKLQRALYPVLRVMGQNGRINPAPLWKEALRLSGVDAGIPRPPLAPGTPAEIEAVKAALVEFGIL